MKKSILISLGFLVGLYASSNDLNITNECKALEIRDLHFGIMEKNWEGKKSTELKYGLKNLTNKKIKNIHATIYLKDSDNNRIFEESYREEDLKPHYEKPLNTSKYWGISPLPKDFSNKADLVIKCDVEESSQKKVQVNTNNKFIDIKIKKGLYESIKANTKTKTDLEAKMSIFLVVKLLDKYKTVDALVKALKNNK